MVTSFILLALTPKNPATLLITEPNASKPFINIGNTAVPTASNKAKNGAITLFNAVVACDNSAVPSSVLLNASLIAKNAATNNPTIPNDMVSVLPN